MTKRRKRKRGKAPDRCRFGDGDGRICGAPIAWIPGIKYPVNPGAIEILLYEEGSPRIEGVTIRGDECWGRRREPGEDGRVVEVWTRHVCDFKQGRRIGPNPDTREKWGADKATEENEE